jgi:hypothetical protein
MYYFFIGLLVIVTDNSARLLHDRVESSLESGKHLRYP